MVTVADIVDDIPSLQSFRDAVEPGGSPPAEGTALQVWLAVLDYVVPQTSRRRLQRDASPSQQLVLNIRLVQALANSCGIADFTAEDALSPEYQRWHRQLARINAFLQYRAEFLRAVTSEVRAHEAIAQQARAVDAQAAAARAEAARFQTQMRLHRDDLHHTQWQVGDLESQAVNLKSQLRDLEQARDVTLVQRADSLRAEIEAARTESQRLVDRAELLRPSVARGGAELRPDVDALRTQLEFLTGQLDEIAENKKKLTLTQETLGVLATEIEELSAARAQARELIEREHAVQAASMQPQLQRRNLARDEVESIRAAETALTAQLAEIEREVQTLHAELVVLEQTERHAQDSNIDQQLADEVRALKQQMASLQEQEHLLQLERKSRRRLIAEITELGTVADKMKLELDVLEQYLHKYTSARNPHRARGARHAGSGRAPAPPPQRGADRDANPGANSGAQDAL